MRDHLIILVSIGGILFLLGLVVCALYTASMDRNVEVPLVSEYSNDAVEFFFLERIDEKGGRFAYSEFIKAYSAQEQGDQHTAAHLFGGALYRVAGTAGLSVCDDSFSFGCYHEFLGQAIANEGLGIMAELNQGCRDILGSQALGCQHGIGHGIISSVGYEPEDLLSALSYCKELSYNDPIGGCYGGVFMEYNMRTMLSLDGVPAREVVDSDLHTPCDTVPVFARNACYYWQPQWWLGVFGDNSFATYTEMGKMCEILDEGAKQKCFEGIGNNTSVTSSGAAEAAQQCAAAATDLLHETYCRADAANSFSAVPELREEAPELCLGLRGVYNEYCLAYSKNEPGDINALKHESIRTK